MPNGCSTGGISVRSVYGVHLIGTSVTKVVSPRSVCPHGASAREFPRQYHASLPSVVAPSIIQQDGPNEPAGAEVSPPVQRVSPWVYWVWRRSRRGVR